MAVFNGTNLGVYIGGTIIAAAQDVSLSLSAEMIDITTKDSAAFRELLPGLRSGSMSCNGLIDFGSANKDTIDLWDAYEGRSLLSLKFDDTGGGAEFTASGYITSLELSGGTEDTATFSATFELTGTISQA